MTSSDAPEHVSLSQFLLELSEILDECNTELEALEEILHFCINGSTLDYEKTVTIQNMDLIIQKQEDLYRMVKYISDDVSRTCTGISVDLLGILPALKLQRLAERIASINSQNRIHKGEVLPNMEQASGDLDLF